MDHTVRYPSCRLSRTLLNQMVDKVGRRALRSIQPNQLRSARWRTSLSRVFAALADPTRRDMVARLAVGDATVGELAAPYDVSVQAVSKHLKVLEDAGLVSRSRDAQRRPVHLEAEVFDLMTKWIERYRQQAEERYRRLDAVLARDERHRRIDTPPKWKERHHDHHDATDDDRGRPQTSRSSGSPATSRRRPSSCCGRTPTRSCSRSGSDPTACTTRIVHWDAGPAAAGATSPSVTARSSASTAPSTRSAPTGSCRPSRTRASPTASRWRR